MSVYTDGNKLTALLEARMQINHAHHLFFFLIWDVMEIPLSIVTSSVTSWYWVKSLQYYSLGFPTQNRMVLLFVVSGDFYTDWPVR